jgi:hypothetical protein
MALIAERRQGDKKNQYTLWPPRGAPPCTCSYHAVCESDNLNLCRERAPFLSGGLPAPALFGARGGRGEAALHLERRGGEHSRPCLPIPPKELSAKSNVDCIRMQPSIRWNAVLNVDCSRGAEILRSLLAATHPAPPPLLSCLAPCFHDPRGGRGAPNTKFSGPAGIGLGCDAEGRKQREQAGRAGDTTPSFIQGPGG